VSIALVDRGRDPGYTGTVGRIHGPGPHMAQATALLALLAIAPPTDPTARESWFWNAPPQCPSGETVRAEIEAHLGEPMAELPLEDWSVVGTVTHDEDAGYAVALVIETPDGRHDRLLTDPSSCDALSSSAALLVALALSPDSDALGPDPDPKPEPDPKPQPNPEPQPGPEPVESAPEIEPVEPAQPASSPEPLTFAVSLAPGLDWGTLRGVTPHSRLALAWQPRRLRVSVAAHFGANPAFELPDLPLEIRLWRWSLAGEIGPVPTLGRFEFPLMAGIEAGQLLLTPSALVPRSSQVAWAALLVTPGVSWVPLDWFAVTAQAGTTVAFVQPTFEVTGLDPILVPSRIGVRAYLGVEFRVPLIMKTD